MGIPWYFKSIIDKHPEVIRNKPPDVCSRLYLDFNSIIHCCSAEVMQHGYDEDAVFNKIAEHIDLIARECLPEELLYIAVDGVAPIAKQIQQRKRRHLTAFRNSMIREYKTRNDIQVEEWDSNCITPGTGFMDRLDVFMNSYVLDKRPYRVVYSGHREHGEGEQKIIKHIRENRCVHCDVIYGLDADLIMLSMLCDSKIYLMRESNTYVDIPVLSACVSRCLSGEISKQALCDYVFMCFMLGNDFLPGVQFLKLREGALDMISNAYRSVENKPLLQKQNEEYVINKTAFCELVDVLARHEDDNMKSLTNRYYNIYYDPKKRSFKTRLDKFVFELDSYPIINKYPENIINPIIDQKWRQSYYYHLFGSNNISLLNDSVLNYLEGLVWTTNYYFNMEYDLGWHYRYNYAPTMSDIQKCLYGCKIEAMHKKLKVSKLVLNEDKQLLTVIPMMSIGVIPERLWPLMKDIRHGCVHYYPLRFCLGTYMKHALHECIPIIPNINFQNLFEAYEKLTVTP